MGIKTIIAVSPKRAVGACRSHIVNNDEFVHPAEQRRQGDLAVNSVEDVIFDMLRFDRRRHFPHVGAEGVDLLSEICQLTISLVVSHEPFPVLVLRRASPRIERLSLALSCSSHDFSASNCACQ